MCGAPSHMWGSTTSLSVGLRWDVEMFSWISGLGPSSWSTERRLILKSQLHMSENYDPR